MNKGPEIKMPGFIRDLYGDLRDRRLLPVVALLLAAAVAVPFLLGKSTPEFTATAGQTGVAVATDDTGKLVAVTAETDPGVRDYSNRLSGKGGGNPFKEKYKSPATSAPTGSGGGSDGESSGQTGSGSGSTSNSTDPGTVDVTVDSGTTNVIPDTTTTTSNPNEPTVVVVKGPPEATIRFGEAGSGDLLIKDPIEKMTLLPAKRPVAIFLGTSDGGRKAVFSISPNVHKITGEGSCSGPRKECGYLVMKPGQAANLFDGARLIIWRLNVVDINRTVELRKAGSTYQGNG